MNNADKRVPDLLVERVHLNEASEAERALVHGNPDAMARLAALPEQDAAFLSAHPVPDGVQRIHDRARIQAAQAAQGNQGGRVMSALLAPVLAGILALLFVNWPMQPHVPDPDIEASTPKGLQAKLRVYRLRGTGVERLAPGTVAREGDVLQLGVVSAGSQNGVVVSVDGSGNVTLHHPADTKSPTTFASGEHRLTHGYELDAAPEFERFFLVTSGHSRSDVSTVVHAAEALAAAGTGRNEGLSLPKGYDQASFLVRKEAR